MESKPRLHIQTGSTPTQCILSPSKLIVKVGFRITSLSDVAHKLETAHKVGQRVGHCMKSKPCLLVQSGNTPTRCTLFLCKVKGKSRISNNFTIRHRTHTEKDSKSRAKSRAPHEIETASPYSDRKYTTAVYYFPMQSNREKSTF